MNNQEFFDYLKILDKLPYISYTEWYRLLLKNDICIKDYYLTYSKIQQYINNSIGMDRMIESVSLLLEIIDNQKDFDKFVKDFNNMINMYISYSNNVKFVNSVEANYINILRRLSKKWNNTDKILSAMRVIVNPSNALVNGKMFTCDWLDSSPKSHLKLYNGNGDSIDNIAMITYVNGDNKIHKIRSYGEYKNCILKLKEMIKSNNIDFAVCSYVMKYGTIVPLFNALLMDGEMV